MPLATWPEGLPYEPERRQFRRAQVRPARTTEPEEGPIITRTEAFVAIKRMPYAISFTSAQKAVFDGFFFDTLHRGTDHFIMPVPLINSSYVERRCYIENADVQEEVISSTHERVLFTLCAFVAELPA